MDVEEKVSKFVDAWERRVPVTEGKVKPVANIFTFGPNGRCRFLTSDERRCRMLTGSMLCPFHASKYRIP